MSTEDHTPEAAPDGTSVPAAFGEVPALAQKRQLAAQRAEALRRSQELQAAEATLRAQVEAQMREMKKDMDARVAAMKAELAPLTEQVRRMEEGIWTVNLYLGRDEEIVALRANETLPAAEPGTAFTLRQDVLSMDEETAAHAEVDGIDARNLDVFDAWIAEPANLERVLPEKKGVVALVPRRRGRDYADPWMNTHMAEANTWTYWLIRNGERVWRMSTDFVVGRRLIPATDEFTRLFIHTRFDRDLGHDVSDILTPGTPEWDAAAKAQDARERHYMRVALILQGLIDRTTVLHPLPAHGLNLLDQRTYDDGYAVLVRDAEAQVTDGRPDFTTWLSAKTHELRVGMRVMGAFNTDTFRRAGAEHDSSDYWSPNDRITPRPANRWASVDRPATGELYRLEAKKTIAGVTGYVFKFARAARYTRTSLGPEVPKQRASCLVAPGDAFILPFDLVTVEECRYYLNSRTQRHAYAEMFPLLKACIAAKEDEAAQEAAFRGLLAQALIAADTDLGGTLSEQTAHDPTLAAAHEILDPLVQWWKLRNTYHRALTGDAAHEKRAISDIVAEYRARTGAATTQAVEAEAERAVVAKLLAHDPTIMVIGRTRDGGYRAFAPQPRTYPAGPHIGAPAVNVTQPVPLSDDQIATMRNQAHWMHRDALTAKAVNGSRQVPAAVRDNVWAVEYTTTKTARRIKAADWVQPGTRMDRTRILHTTAVWDSFDVHADAREHLTDPELDACVGELLEEVTTRAAAGWPTNAHPSTTRAPFTPLVLGVTLGNDDYNNDVDAHVLSVHLIDAEDPTPALESPSANAPRATPESLTVRAACVKTRTGVTLTRNRAGTFALRTGNGTRYSTASAGRPWHYYWAGRAKHAIAIVEYPDNQGVADAREARVNAFNDASRKLSEAAHATLAHAYTAANAAKEAAVYVQFLDDYLDPGLWEGHRKSLNEADLTVPWHPAGRDLPALVRRAVYAAADAGLITEIVETTEDAEDAEDADVTPTTRTVGHQVAGHTIGSLLTALDIPVGETQREQLAEFLPLPLHPNP